MKSTKVKSSNASRLLKKQPVNVQVINNVQRPKQSNRRNPNELPQRFAWTACVNNPPENLARIPDQVTTPSCVARLSNTIRITPVSDGAGNYAAGISFIPTMVNSWQVGTALTAGGVLSFGSTSISGFNNFNTQVSTAQGLMRSYRVTGASLVVNSTTAMSLNKGSNYCGFVPGNSEIGAPLIVASASAITMTQLETFSDMPINTEKSCSICWQPSDNYSYRPPASTASNLITVGSANYYYPGAMIWSAFGIDAGSSFEALLTLNIEYLAQSSLLGFVVPVRSRFDVKALEHCVNSIRTTDPFHRLPPESYYGTTPEQRNSAYDGIWTNIWDKYGDNILSAAGYASKKLLRSLARVPLTDPYSMPMYNSMLGYSGPSPH